MSRKYGNPRKGTKKADSSKYISGEEGGGGYSRRISEKGGKINHLVVDFRFANTAFRDGDAGKSYAVESCPRITKEKQKC